MMTSAILALALLTIVLQSEAVEPAPEIFAPGIISAEHHEFSCSFSPDGTEVYFTRRVPEFDRNRIMVSRLVDGKWTQPVLAEKAGER